MNKSLAIETKNLTKTFLSEEIIKGCNMCVEKGSIYGFLEANGAGKTTMFKLLSGLLTPIMCNIIFNTTSNKTIMYLFTIVIISIGILFSILLMKKVNTMEAE